MTDETLQGIIFHLISSNSRYKLEFTRYTQQRDELLKADPIFKDEIIQQYNEMLKSMIADDVVKTLNVSTEDTLVVLSDLNLEEYFK